MEKQSETFQNEIAISNTVIVYNDMESELEENEMFLLSELSTII